MYTQLDIKRRETMQACVVKREGRGTSKNRWKKWGFLGGVDRRGRSLVTSVNYGRDLVRDL